MTYRQLIYGWWVRMVCEGVWYRVGHGERERRRLRAVLRLIQQRLRLLVGLAQVQLVPVAGYRV